MVFNKNRQNVSHDGKADRFGVISGSRSQSHDIATVEHDGFRSGLRPGAGRGDSARAQWVFQAARVIPRSASSAWATGRSRESRLSATVHSAQEFTTGSSHFVGFPLPGYGRAIGRTPVTTTSFESVSDVVTLVPGWNGSGGTGFTAGTER